MAKATPIVSAPSAPSAPPAPSAPTTAERSADLNYAWSDLQDLRGGKRKVSISGKDLDSASLNPAEEEKLIQRIRANLSARRTHLDTIRTIGQADPNANTRLTNAKTGWSGMRNGLGLIAALRREESEVLGAK